MTRGELLQRISIDPNVCFVKPCIRGLRSSLRCGIVVATSRAQLPTVHRTAWLSFRVASWRLCSDCRTRLVTLARMEPD